MYQPIQSKATILPTGTSISRSSRDCGTCGFLLIALAWFALSPPARAALDPAPDGGYPNQNTAEGDNALFNLTTGLRNTAMGFRALFSNTTGFQNTANGAFALQSNTTGDGNTANGLNALFSNTTGNNNTANGVYALASNMSGVDNTANGAGALYSNTAGGGNTANGVYALFSNTTGAFNTANGENALFDNTTGGANTANGFLALISNTTGDLNTASGYVALGSNTTGSFNTANGGQALANNTSGSGNIALGFNAGQNLTTGNNNIDIGNFGEAGESTHIRIGTVGTHTDAVIAGIYKTTVAKGLGVIVDSTGHLGTVGSSERFKDAIKPMDKASEAILSLKPVTFRYKHELDPEGIPQFGLVAEEVEKVNPDLVARDEQGKIYTVRYEAVNAMLLNEFLKEHRKVEEQEATITQVKLTAAKQEATIAQQQKEIKALAASLKEQASQIQKVSDQLEVSRPAPRMVADNQ